ncbi:LTA synthase family protein [Hugenholtzia roseola]|uniref:LTA synthase family protein n=1 Tax=Hugenholtzia roseola TaxID=1002 RepID=UPI00047DF202|nr:LTA synthase family protein [Hugenholtzia roseola]
MKVRLLFLMQLWLYWLSFFAFGRFFFLLYNWEKYATAPFLETLRAFPKALALDLSTTGYLLVLPTLYTFIHFFWQKRFFLYLHKFYHYILILLLVSIQIGEILLYRAWGTKLNAYAVSFLAYPTQMVASLQVEQMVSGFVLWATFLVLAFWGYSRIVGKTRSSVFAFSSKNRAGQGSEKRKVAPLWFASFANFYQKKEAFFVPFLFVLVGSLTFLAIRGGVQLAPINQSAAYYSTLPMLNHLAINTHWNLLFSVLKSKKAAAQVAEQYFEPQKAAELVRQLYKRPYEGGQSRAKSVAHSPDIDPAQYKKTEADFIFAAPRPNIVLVMLESWTADVIAPLGGQPNLTPHFNQLCQEGLLFTKVYATGDRTDKGVVGILSGYPAQPLTSIIKEPHKAEKLPVLAQDLAQIGYQTAILYAGESEYFNFKAYWQQGGFEKIIDVDDFEATMLNSKWGAHDHFAFEKSIEEINHLHQKKNAPFFFSILTLSSHEPYQIPEGIDFEAPMAAKNEVDLFSNAIAYTDWSIGQFLKQARKEAWYDNTLFVFVADHGHRFPKNYADTRDFGKYKIPLLFYGEVLKAEKRGKACPTIASQTDLAATLLAQMNLPTYRYEWSQDILNPNVPHFAFYGFEEGFAWLGQNSGFIYDKNTKTKRAIFGKDTAQEWGLPHQSLDYGKAYLQHLLADYSKK